MKQVPVVLPREGSSVYRRQRWVRIKNPAPGCIKPSIVLLEMIDGSCVYVEGHGQQIPLQDQIMSINNLFTLHSSLSVEQLLSLSQSIPPLSLDSLSLSLSLSLSDSGLICTLLFYLHLEQYSTVTPTHNS